MENTYQDLITDIQSKNPKIGGKLEGGKKFKIKSDFKPAGDQPEAIKKLVNGANNCLLYTSPSPRDLSTSRMPSSA